MMDIPGYFDVSKNESRKKKNHPSISQNPNLRDHNQYPKAAHTILLYTRPNTTRPSANISTPHFDLPLH